LRWLLQLTVSNLPVLRPKFDSFAHIRERLRAKSSSVFPP
jgi:hypothetical protein